MTVIVFGAASLLAGVCLPAGGRCPSVCLAPDCGCAFRSRNKSQKSKFDEALHDEMTTTIDELSSK
jgi:hypothetical protein